MPSGARRPGAGAVRRRPSPSTSPEPAPRRATNAIPAQPALTKRRTAVEGAYTAAARQAAAGTRAEPAKAAPTAAPTVAERRAAKKGQAADTAAPRLRKRQAAPRGARKDSESESPSASSSAESSESYTPSPAPLRERRLPPASARPAALRRRATVERSRSPMRYETHRGRGALLRGLRHRDSSPEDGGGSYWPAPRWAPDDDRLYSMRGVRGKGVGKFGGALGGWGGGGGGGKGKGRGGGYQVSSTRVHVSNLPEKITEAELEKLFSRHGEVLGLQMLGARRGQSCAIVRFSSSSDADASIVALHNRHELRDGSGPINVKLAKPNPRWDA